MGNMKKLRFAPSPSGTLHVGSARTALFNYLLAKASGSKLVLRMEDTDLKRSKKKFEEDILDGLDWLGIEFDEFYRQSERGEVYQKYIDVLLRQDLAYKEDGAVKFRVKKEIITFQDLVRGEIIFDQKLQEDFVIMKSDGSPSYQLAVVVDDYEMGITHVIRGEDHISNTPKQIQIYQALGIEPPSYAHISIILGTDKSKLSKRNGAKSIGDFQMEGYLPKAVFNFLALLGWSHPDDTEILTKQELFDSYHIDRVSKSNSVFDPEKLAWYNSKYMQKLSHKELAMFIPNGDTKVAKMIQPKLRNLCDIPTWTKFLEEPVHIGVSPRWWKDLLLRVEVDTLSTFKELIGNFLSTFEVDKGTVYSEIRYGMTGERSGLPLFEVHDYLGRKEVVRRMKRWK